MLRQFGYLQNTSDSDRYWFDIGGETQFSFGVYEKKLKLSVLSIEKPETDTLLEKETQTNVLFEYLRTIKCEQVRTFAMVGSTKIRISYRDRMVNHELLEPDEKRVAKGMSNTIEGDTKITYDGTSIKKGVGGPEVSEWVLQIGTSVSAGVLGNWIYDRLKDRGVEHLEIGGEEVEVDEDSIQEKLDKYTDD